MHCVPKERSVSVVPSSVENVEKDTIVIRLLDVVMLTSELVVKLTKSTSRSVVLLPRRTASFTSSL